jgi:glycerol transport system ATP-binding protein
VSVTLDNVTRLVDGIPTIRDVSLTLEKGTLSVLLGPTLSGKTSIMRLLAGLDKPSTGRVLADGEDVTGFDVRKRSVAMVYQQFINYPSLSVYENIASPLRVQGKPRAEIEKRVAEAAKLLRLEPYLERTPLQLSGGQQQRTAIARALVKGADLVLLDEPLANLDYKLREELRAELPRIFEASGAIFVYATTEPSEALLLGGRTICMWEGRILQAGDTPKVYRHPDTIRVAQVFSDPPLNLVWAEKRDGVIQYATGVVAPASGLYAGLENGEYRIGFRAHQLELANGQPGRHVFPAIVTVTEITGSESFVHMTREDLNWVAVLHGVHEFEPGHALDAVLDPDNVFVFETATGRLVASPGTIALSSEMPGGSRDENASRNKRAFSSEVPGGSREENASRNKST